MNSDITFSGVVKHGKKRGRLLGFPTANIGLTQEIPEGIYLSWVEFEDRKLPSLTFVGSAKTFNEDEYQAEVFLLNFNEDLYDKTLSVELIRKLRDNKWFSSQEALIEQMEDDKKQGEDYFSTIKR